jgi:hypothetical protein
MSYIITHVRRKPQLKSIGMHRATWTNARCTVQHPTRHNATWNNVTVCAPAHVRRKLQLEAVDRCRPLQRRFRRIVDQHMHRNAPL